MKKIEVENWDKVLKWSYNLARQYAIDNLVPQGVTSARKFDAYKRAKKFLPKKYPRIPDEYFTRKGTWKGWRDFLGYPDQSRRKDFLSYKDAARVTRDSKISNSKEYLGWKQRPPNLPARPEYYYEEWNGWKDFLGDMFRPPDPRHYTKLTVSDVRIIKHQLKMGVSGAILARTFNVSEMQISRIKHGQNWNEI